MSSRTQLIDYMAKLEGQGINCSHCTGLCCTYTKNSMKISHEEAVTIGSYLREQGEEFKNKMLREIEQTIADYRLDKFIQMKSSLALRRYYTCSFYLETNGTRGCVLPRSVRPLGCLAFNPVKKNANQDVDCKTLLEWKKDAGHDLESIPVAVKNYLSHF